MAFKAVIHKPEQERIQELYKDIAKFRVEKTLKYIRNMGVTNDAIRECMEIKEPSGNMVKVS